MRVLLFEVSKVMLGCQTIMSNWQSGCLLSQESNQKAQGKLAKGAKIFSAFIGELKGKCETEI